MRNVTKGQSEEVGHNDQRQDRVTHDAQQGHVDLTTVLENMSVFIILCSMND